MSRFLHVIGIHRQPLIKGTGPRLEMVNSIPAPLLYGTSLGQFVYAVRVATGTIAAGDVATVTVTWPNQFADTNYTATATVLESTGSLAVVGIVFQNAAEIQVLVRNNGSVDLSGTIHAVGVHD